MRLTRLAIGYLIVFLFSLLFYKMYSSNSQLVTYIAYVCLGISLGRLAYKIADWLCHIITKNKKEEK